MWATETSAPASMSLQIWRITEWGDAGGGCAWVSVGQLQDGRDLAQRRMGKRPHAVQWHRRHRGQHEESRLSRQQQRGVAMGISLVAVEDAGFAWIPTRKRQTQQQN